MSLITYHEFAKRVISNQRYFYDNEICEFLDAVRTEIPRYEIPFPKGNSLWRAQLGSATYIKEIDGAIVDEIRGPYGEKRMKPDANKVGEGRVNARGIAVLYLCSKPTTAMHEVRPWVGSRISVAEFTTTGDLRVVDFTALHGKNKESLSPPRRIMGAMGTRIPPMSKKQLLEELMIDINYAFSTPVSRQEDSVQYVPTQIIVDLVKKEKYHGIAYNSVFSAGLNLALFDPSSAKMLSCGLCDVKEIGMNFGNPYDPLRSDGECHPSFLEDWNRANQEQTTVS
ncbi:RES family NAD+ phosphorylase [uncultured Lamprocystis sp.]|jgi:hypothetical protein|uniref:RES family NAD+ phosphorylase n=1 Tax=uncultured Lamprocystis sp. TaxID=543132 RepID=UPI0025DBF941|nr:RES family NAD+ phosphorylase [uncultured Lamprocystis sp.]